MARSYTAKKQRQTPANNAGKSRRRNTRTPSHRASNAGKSRRNTRTPSQKQRNRTTAINRTRTAYGKSKGEISPNPRHIRFLLALLFYEDREAYEETMLKLTMSLPHKVTLDFIKHCYKTKLDVYFQVALYYVFIFLQKKAFGGGDDYEPEPPKTYGHLLSLLIDRYKPAHDKYIENIRDLLADLFYKGGAYEKTMLKLTMDLPHEVTLNFIKHCYETELNVYFQVALYKVFIFLQEEAFGGGDDYDPSKTYGYLSSLLIDRYRPAHAEYIKNKNKNKNKI